MINEGFDQEMLANSGFDKLSGQEREVPFYKKSIEGYLETLSNREKDNLIKLHRLVSSLKASNKVFYKYFGPIDRDSGYPSYTMLYDPRGGFFTGKYGEALTYSEMVKELEKEETSVDESLDYYKKWRQDELIIISIIQDVVEKPITQEDHNDLPDILKKNYQTVSEELVKEQKSRASKGLSPELLEKAVWLAKLSEHSIPEEEIIEIQKTYHRKKKERMLSLAQEKKAGGESPASIMLGWMDSAVKSAEFLGEDTSFAKPFAESAVLDAIEGERKDLTRSRNSRFYFKELEKNHFPFWIKRVERWAQIAGMDVTNEMNDLEQEYQKLVKKAEVPFWKRPFVK